MVFSGSAIGVLIFLLLTLSTKAVRFPSYIQKCHRSDPDVKLCYIRAIDVIKSHFDRGVQEFYLPTMSPLTLSEITLENENNFKAIFRNIEIYHLEELKVIDVDINLDTDQFTFDLLIPRVRIKSDYKIQGKIVLLMLDGNGPADGNFTDVEVQIKLQGSRYKRGSKEYIKFSKMEIKDKLHNAVFHFQGLFKGNPKLTEQTNRILNDNIEELMDELKPTIHGAVEQTILGLLRRMFEKFSVKDLFPE